MALDSYDINALLLGRVNWYIAPHTATLPTRIADIVGQVSPYTPGTNWELGGATSGPSTYSRNITTAGVDIQQTSSVVLEEIEEVTRTIAAPFAEVTPELLQRLEQSAAIDTVASAVNKSAEKQVAFGSINELDEYRVAFIGRRKEAQSLVTEPGGVTRGAMLAFVAFRCTLAAENTQVQFGENELVSVPMTFSVLNDPAVTTTGEEAGFWLEEQAGTIVAS